MTSGIPGAAMCGSFTLYSSDLAEGFISYICKVANETILGGIVRRRREVIMRLQRGLEKLIVCRKSTRVQYNVEKCSYAHWHRKLWYRAQLVQSIF